MIALRRIIRLHPLCYDRVKHLLSAVKKDRKLKDLIFDEKRSFKVLEEQMFKHPKIKNDKYTKVDEILYTENIVKEIINKNLKMKKLGVTERFYSDEYRSTFRKVVPPHRVKKRNPGWDALFAIVITSPFI